MKFTHRWTNEQVSMSRWLKFWILMKLGHWWEEEMKEYRDMCAESDYEYYQYLLSVERNERQDDPDGLPF